MNQVNKYRVDLQFLRGISVILVLFYHLGVPGFDNGYLGVDIFFAVSGYLITGIIYREVQKDSFSIVDFYIRRTRRIIPLVSFICLFSLCVGIYSMLPDDLENLTQSIEYDYYTDRTLKVIIEENKITDDEAEEVHGKIISMLHESDEASHQ